MSSSEHRRIRAARVADLIPPDGWTVEQPAVDMLAESISEHGLREPIVTVGRHILHGVHRWRAAVQLGLDTIEAVEDVPAESSQQNEARVIAENLHRRHLDGAQLSLMRQRLLALSGAKTAPKVVDNIEDEFFAHGAQKTPRAPGRPRGSTSAHADAKRAVARQTGVSVSAISRSIARPADAARRAVEQRVAAAMTGARIDDCDEYGNTIPASLSGAWEAARADCRELDQLLRRAQTVCKRLIDCSAVEHAWAQQCLQLIHQIGYEARSKSPWAICPKCGGKKCDLCRNTGFCPGQLTRSEYEKMVNAQPAEPGAAS
jgi:ParB-like nuclease domain